MNDTAPSPRSREDWRRGRSEAINRFLAEYASCEHSDLLFQMLVTICRLAADQADRGDIKILNTALKELRYAFKVFAPYAEVPKVTMFGSARTPEGHPQYVEAKRFAELMQQNGWMIITGAGDGIMRAGHHGATRSASFGVAISLPFEQKTNPIIADDPKLVNFKYFFTRKLIFIKEARAIALFPGGFGTQDEGFESLTLVQTVKASPMPIVMVEAPDDTYWKGWRRFVEDDLLAHRMIDAADLDLFRICERADEAVAEIVRFYRRYHSCRFVGEYLAMRLNRPLSSETVSLINAEFADIITADRFEQTMGPIAGEGSVYPDKARLVFAYDRRGAGRLRQLINMINDAP